MKKTRPNANNLQLFHLKSIGSSDLGYITVFQRPDKTPFVVRRVFWTYFTPNHVERGNHAHHKLSEVLVAVHGTVDVRTENVRREHAHFKLNNPDKALYLPPRHWFTLKFSHDAVLLMFADMKYDEREYIRDYEQFKKLKA